MHKYDSEILKGALKKDDVWPAAAGGVTSSPPEDSEKKLSGFVNAIQGGSPIIPTPSSSPLKTFLKHTAL
ncbi:hypothetical protein Abor_014_147 [Acetobacter orientalis]|uniref:Uncharacterized protein n=1 Tax=Acetobacter orientalis TaxID=146474 RepID=A0A0D6NIT3_9PROT|nr:hypothetical protein Abor_014_147 [Acetobacter orientalis]